MAGIHNVFHVGYLRKCLAETDKVLPLQEVQIDDKLRYVEEPDCIVNTKTFKLRHKEIEMVLVQWKHHRGSDLTWESKTDMMTKYPHLFSNA